jgi:hypothetical protein
MKLTTTHYALGGLAVMLYYFWINNTLSKELIALIGVAGVVIFLLKQPKEEERFITLDEAIIVAENQIPKLQDKRIVENGTLNIVDAGIQMLVLMDELRPWRYMIGYQISGAKRPYDYMISISVTGSILSNESKEEGWQLCDEPLLLKVAAPTAEISVLPRSETANEMKVGKVREVL